MYRLLDVGLYLMLSLLFLLAGTTVAYADCGNPQTQTEMNICAAEDYKVVDAELNVVYSRSITGLDQSHQTALKKAQRAWISYRDLACHSYGLSAEGGSMQSMLVSSCLADVTRQRIKILSDQFQSN